MLWIRSSGWIYWWRSRSRYCSYSSICCCSRGRLCSCCWRICRWCIICSRVCIRSGLCSTLGRSVVRCSRSRCCSWIRISLCSLSRLCSSRWSFSKFIFYSCSNFLCLSIVCVVFCRVDAFYVFGSEIRVFLFEFLEELRIFKRKGDTIKLLIRSHYILSE